MAQARGRARRDGASSASVARALLDHARQSRSRRLCTCEAHRGGSLVKKKTICGLVLGLAIALAGVGGARADECHSGCGVGTVACMKTARTDRGACRASCRQSSGRKARGCMRACVATFRDARSTCGSDHDDCVATCTPPSGGPSDGACEGACGRALGSCARNVMATARSCVQGCGGSVHHESEDGSSDGGQSHGDRGACAHGCASAAHDGLEGCRDDFETCMEACGGSPSGAFVD
jgi:hypothetical protein